MSNFIFDSEEFQRELHESAHHLGEVEFLRSILRPGMRVIEVGSNRGVTAVAIAREIGTEGHLYAFEPVPEFYRELQENLVRNKAENVSTHQIALSNRRGRIQFYKHGGSSGITPADDAETLYVEATTVPDFLDEQGEDAIDLMNLDCEGSELLVLQGAKRILEKHGPPIFCEVHSGYLGELDQSIDDITGLLGELGYQIRPILAEDLNAKSNTETCSHIYAWKPERDRQVESLKRKIADLSARMPVHSVRPSMVQELEELEEELEALQKELGQEAKQ